MRTQSRDLGRGSLTRDPSTSLVPRVASPLGKLGAGSELVEGVGITTGTEQPSRSAWRTTSGLPSRPGPSSTTQTLVYGYDALYWLTSAGGGPAGYTTYTYDPVGNRLTRTRNSTSQISDAYDKADRITAAGATARTRDDETYSTCSCASAGSVR